MLRSSPRALVAGSALALLGLAGPAAAQPYEAPPDDRRPDDRRPDDRRPDDRRPDDRRPDDGRPDERRPYDRRLAEPPPPAPRPRPERETISATYLQLTMGFIAGGRRYTDAAFEDQNGVAPALVDPFSRAPFDGTTALGLRYDLRATVSYVRATIGFDVPFPDFRSKDTTATYMLNGKSVTVSAQSLRPYELRFGIGAEYPVWVFAPFVDLMGYAYWADAALSVDDVKAEYRARGFGFSLRGGARVHVKDWFFLQAAGEAGLYGPVRWNAELSIGFAVPAKRRRW